MLMLSATCCLSRALYPAHPAETDPEWEPSLTDSDHEYSYSAKFLPQVNGVASMPVGVYVGDCLYNETAARQNGDTNHDCRVDLVDFAAMASKWLDNESL